MKMIFIEDNYYNSEYVIKVSGIYKAEPQLYIFNVLINGVGHLPIIRKTKDEAIQTQQNLLHELNANFENDKMIKPEKYNPGIFNN